MAEKIEEKTKKFKVVYSEQFSKDLVRLFSNNLVYSIPRWFSNAKMKIKHAWQRVFRGFDDTWYWNLNNSIATTVPKCVKAMRKDGMGYPGGLTDKKEWNIILKKIEEGFEAFDKMDNCKYNSKKYKKLEKKHNEGLQLFIKWFPNLWD